MRVLMQIRDNYLTGPGGDTIQFLKTKEYLEKIGVEAVISTELEPDLSGFDLVHLFNLTRIQETYIQAKNAKKQGKKIALSTIYWPYDEINDAGFKGIRQFVYKILPNDRIENVKALYKYIFRGERNKGCRALILGTYSKMQKWVVENSDICLPNAAKEMEKIDEYLHVEKQYVVVPNAIDLIGVNAALEYNGKEFDEYKDYIICVARISRRKNQMLLVEAVKNTEYKVLFVGKSSPGEMDYYQEFIEAIKQNPNIKHIEAIPNADLYKLYKVCKVSVLPSWFETPGLVSLEAGAMGCNIVITDKGTTRDYFGDMAYYFELNSESLKIELEKAYKEEPNYMLQKKILSEYTWEKAAEKTLEGYFRIIEEKI